MPVETLGDGPNEPDPKGLPGGLQTFLTTTENHTHDRIPKNTSENAPRDSVMQFVVQTFEQINTMYSSFSLKRKEVHHTSIPNNDHHPIMEPWQSDLEGLTDGAAQGMPEDTMLPDKPTKKGKAAFENPNGFPRQKHATNAAFYSKPFTFKETVGGIAFYNAN
ncbi:hypothetical protein Tco_0958678 [Tanacetum coccineum]